MRLLLVSPGFPPDKTGGIENHVQMLSGEMKRRGHVVRILTRFNRSSINNPDVIQLKRPEGELKGYGSWAIKAWLKSHTIDHDLVHFHGFDGQILSILPYVTRAPRVLHIHNSLTVEPEWFQRDPLRHRVGYFLASRSFRMAKLIMAPTETVKNDIMRHLPNIEPESINVVPNFVDTRLYAPKKQTAEIREAYSLKGKFVILYFGKIKRTKGIEDLCKAFSIVKSKINAALIIGGASTATDNFLNYLKSTYRDVIFTGFVKDPREIYAAADVFVIYTPGFHGGEVFPIALLEAMSMGLPVVCSDSPIFREVTKDDAIFVQPNSPSSLANALVDLSNSEDKGRKRGLRHRSVTETNYDVRKVVGQIESIYDRTLNRQ